MVEWWLSYLKALGRDKMDGRRGCSDGKIILARSNRFIPLHVRKLCA